MPDMINLADYLKGDTPFSIIALAVLYNLLRRAIELYHERKRDKQTAEEERVRAREEAEETRLRIDLASKLASALKEVEYLRAERDGRNAERERGA